MNLIVQARLLSLITPLICFAGDLIESKFDTLPKFFLSPKSGFGVGEFGYHYAKAAELGRSGQSVDECEARFKCPLSRNEFAKMILT